VFFFVDTVYINLKHDAMKSVTYRIIFNGDSTEGEGSEASKADSAGVGCVGGTGWAWEHQIPAVTTVTPDGLSWHLKLFAAGF